MTAKSVSFCLRLLHYKYRHSSHQECVSNPLSEEVCEVALPFESIQVGMSVFFDYYPYEPSRSETTSDFKRLILAERGC